MADTSSSSVANPTRTHWLLLAGIVVLAAVLRLIFISTNEAHFDEVWHLEISTGRGEAHTHLPMNQIVLDAPHPTKLDGAPPWYKVLTTLDGQTHPPLHYVLLRFWRELFGESLTVGRIMSAILSMLCVIVLFDAARQVFSPATSLWACLIFALSSAQIEAAQEVRGYPLLLLLALCAADALLRIERFGLSARRAVAMGLSLMGTLLTHYFAAPLVFAMWLYAMIRMRGPRRRAVVLVILSSMVLFLVMWGPAIRRQRQAFAETGGPGAYQDNEPNRTQATLQRLAVAPLRLLFDPRPNNAVVAMLSASILLLPWLMLRKVPALLLWSIWLVCVIAFVAALDFTRGTRHLGAVRHTLLAGPALCVILPALVSGMGKRMAHAVPAMIAVACLGALGLTYHRANVGLSGLGDLLADARGTDEPVLFYTEPGHTWWAQWLYLSAAHYSDAFPRPVAILDRPADEQLLTQLKQNGRVWLVWSHTPLKPPAILPGCRVTWSRFEPFVAQVARVEWAQPQVASP